ncbi:MAG: diguanylate cyclase [Betaproteobacteria bacterium]|nr:diguanylate cyclase [Betaproteobacteria bacterium]
MSNALAKSNIKDVAREALRALVVRKLDPSPENYRRLYNEIAGVDEAAEGSAAEQTLGRIAHDFPRTSPELLRVAKAMERAAGKRDWGQLAGLLHEANEAISRYYAAAESWRGLLAELLQQFDASHKGLSRLRKKERLERVLELPASTPEQLQQKLAALVRSWAELATEAAAPEPDPSQTGELKRPAQPHAAAFAQPLVPDDTIMLCDLLAHVLDIGMAALLAYDPAMALEAESLAQQARSARAAYEFNAVRAATKSFLLKVELTTSNTADLHQGILRLLRLVVENVAALVGEDDWLHGQISVLAEIVSQPLDLVMIQHAERSIKDAILRQGTLRHSLTEAKTAFKSMVSGFIDRLGEFSTSTGDYHETIERLSTRIKSTDDIIELSRILDQVAAATRQVQAATLRSREETLKTQEEVRTAEQKVRELQTELSRVSAKVREDQLTGALNRRGLEEEFDRSCAASERRQEPMSLALLDIDDFKKLNDTHGHMAGDNALVHLAKVIRSTVRPTDVVCRYGGEEFVILLPGTSLQDAVVVISRLQRELTKRFFLHDNQRLLLTFSAGIAERRGGETREQTIGRADAAMYQAKRSGKNRVLVAE